MCDRSMIRAVMVVATLLSTSGAHAQGSAGTGSTSTGIGEPTGPAGPGIRRNGWTQTALRKSPPHHESVVEVNRDEAEVLGSSMSQHRRKQNAIAIRAD